MQLWRRWLLLGNDLCLPHGKQRGLIGKNFLQKYIDNLLHKA